MARKRQRPRDFRGFQTPTKRFLLRPRHIMDITVGTSRDYSNDDNIIIRGHVLSNYLHVSRGPIYIYASVPLSSTIRVD